MSKVHGRNFAVWVDGSKVGDCRDCTLTINQADVPATSKDDSNWMRRLTGMRDWSVDVDQLWDEDNTFDMVDLVDLILNASTVQVEFSLGANGSSGDTYFYGDAILSSQSISAPMEDVTSGSATFVSDGPLSKATISTS